MYSLNRIANDGDRATVFSPVDLVVTDPDGLVISTESNDIQGAVYVIDDFDGDGDPDDAIGIPDRKLGVYQITVVPESGADPSETYSLEVTAGNQTFTLAQDMPVDSIPSGPYTLNVAETEVNAAPVANANGPYSGLEGSSISFEGACSYDVDGSISLYEWDVDDNGLYDFDSDLSAATYVYGDDYRGNVTLRVTDDDGLVGIDKVEVFVVNVAPTIDVITAPTDPVEANTAVNVQGNFTDPGILDTHTGEWDWGDTSTSPGTP